MWTLRRTCQSRRKGPGTPASRQRRSPDQSEREELDVAEVKQPEPLRKTRAPTDLWECWLLSCVGLDHLVPGESPTFLLLLLLRVTERLGGEALLQPPRLQILAQGDVVDWLQVLLGQVVVGEGREVLDGVRVEEAQRRVSRLVPSGRSILKQGTDN